MTPAAVILATEQIEIVTKYLKLVEAFAADRTELARLLHPDFVQTEFPNAMTKKTQERGVDGCIQGLEQGRAILSEQRIEVKQAFETGARVAVEALWSGTMARDAGPLKQGQQIKAFFCMIFEFREGRIFRQRNYDCYEPFTG